MVEMGEKWAGMGSALASMMFLWAVISKYFPYQWETYFSKYTIKLVRLVYPYIEIKFAEHTGERFSRSSAYSAIEAYLAAICTGSATKLKADIDKDSTALSLSMDDNEEVTDTYEGVKVWWSFNIAVLRVQSFSFLPAPDEKRFYKLTFHRRDRDFIEDKYLAHVMEEGKAVGVKKRQRKLYTNNNDGKNPYSKLWSHVPFEHPATFETVAMDPKKKQDIIQDLRTFSKSKGYYSRIGKAWKRGYLLYGPPGTGKSSMVAAMANLLDYDVYDLELTAVPNNTTLRRLLIETTSKSIIVIEDVDCTLDLVEKRNHKKARDDDEKEGTTTLPPRDDKDLESKMTLSGMLNFIDGLWSACSGERLIILTTNHVEKLDPALTRRGRMDKHIELSYCGFEAFKVLAKNYLDIEWHPLYDEVREMMAKVKITPADVAECLIPKRQAEMEEEATACLKELIMDMEKLDAVAAVQAEATAKAEKASTSRPLENGCVKEDGEVKGARQVENGDVMGNGGVKEGN